MQKQHLDANNVELGVMTMISPAAGAAQNLDYGAALARAMNEWQVAEWTSKETRLKASIVDPLRGSAGRRCGDRALGRPYGFRAGH